MAITSRVAIHKDTTAVRELNPEEFSGLMQSIGDHGQLVSIKTHRGEVIDGRATLRACQRLRITPRFEEIDPDLDPKVIIDILNLRRRHLNPTELAMAASRLGLRRPEECKQIGVSRRSVQLADKVHRLGAPETIEAATRGELSVSLAAQLADLPVEEQVEAVAQVREGRKSEVTSRVRKIAPAAPAVVTPDQFAEQFRDKVVDRLEAFRLLVGELAEHERMIALSFFGIEPEQSPTPVTVAAAPMPEPEDFIVPEPQDFFVEVVRDRITDEMLASPKMLGLASRLGSKATAVGVVRLLLSVTEAHAPRGDIGKLSDAAFAKACEFAGRGDEFVSALVQEGWLQRDREHRLLVADWPELCPKDLAEELVGTGEGFAEPTGPPAEVKEKNPRRLRDRPPENYSSEFEAFWTAYPSVRRMRKAEAWESWKKALKKAKPPEGVTVEAWLIQRAGEYAKSWKGKGQYSQAPGVWLNGGCWDDAPAAWTEFEAGHNGSTVEVRRPMRPMGAPPRPKATAG